MMRIRRLKKRMEMKNRKNPLRMNKQKKTQRHPLCHRAVPLPKRSARGPINPKKQKKQKHHHPSNIPRRNKVMKKTMWIRRKWQHF